MIVFGSVFGNEPYDISPMVDIDPPVIVVGHAVEGVEPYEFGGIDAFFDHLDDVALADVDVGTLRWAWTITFDLADSDVYTTYSMGVGVHASK